MSVPTVPTREYIPVDRFLEANRDPITGRRRIGRDALYAGIHAGRVPDVRLGRRILVPSDLLDLLVTRSSDDAGPFSQAA